MILKFLIKHKCELSDVVFKCDSDCRQFIKGNGLRPANVGDAHILADIVAWANNRNVEPEGVIMLDLANVFKEKTMKFYSK